MKALFSLSFCCFLVVLSGLMTSCGKPTLREDPVAISPRSKTGELAAVAASEKPQGEESAAKSEVSETVAEKKEPAATPEKPQVEKPVEKPEVSKSAAAPDKAQLEEAAKAIVEAAGREAEKKNAPKPKRSQADNLPVVELTVNQHEWVEHNTGMGGDEQGVTFMVYSKHQQNCSILRDKTTGFEAVFRYRSKVGYVGKDFVELEYSDHQLGSGPDDPGTTTKTRQVINITVVEKEKK